MSLAEEFYNNNIENNSKESNALSVKVNFIGWSRLAVIILGVMIDYILYKQNNIILIMTFTIVFVLIFLFLVIYHNKIFENKRKLDMLIEINKKGLKRLKGEFKEFKDNGAEYLDDENSFINDLDIFGESSIFQYVNNTVTKGGREALVKLLKREKPLDKNEIKNNQEAIEELAQKARWRQQLIVEGTLRKSKNMDLENLINWSKKKSSSSSSLRIAISCTFMLVTIFFIYLSASGVIPASAVILDLMVNYCVVKVLAKSMNEEFKLFETIKRI